MKVYISLSVHCSIQCISGIKNREWHLLWFYHGDQTVCTYQELLSFSGKRKTPFRSYRRTSPQSCPCGLSGRHICHQNLWSSLCDSWRRRFHAVRTFNIDKNCLQVGFLPDVKTGTWFLSPHPLPLKIWTRMAYSQYPTPIFYMFFLLLVLHSYSLNQKVCSLNKIMFSRQER